MLSYLQKHLKATGVWSFATPRSHILITPTVTPNPSEFVFFKKYKHSVCAHGHTHTHTSKNPDNPGKLETHFVVKTKIKSTDSLLIGKFMFSK